MIEKIYFDMDGVLADFDGGVTRLCGLRPILQGEHRTKEEDDLMWERIRKVSHFYDELDPMRGRYNSLRKSMISMEINARS